MEENGDDSSAWLEERDEHGEDWDEDDPLRIDERRR
jgi:hypothetical protein